MSQRSVLRLYHFMGYGPPLHPPYSRSALGGWLSVVAKLWGGRRRGLRPRERVMLDVGPLKGLDFTP